jgi:hypothetical protein
VGQAGGIIMDKNALLFAAMAVIVFLLCWIETKLSRIIGQLGDANETLASILDAVEKR